MSVLLHLGTASVGLMLIVIFVRSASHVALVNRRSSEMVARFVGSMVHKTLSRRARRLRSYADVQDVMAWALPTYVISLIVVWFALVQLGFSLLIWTVRVEPAPLQAFIASGSALSTLGFFTPPGMAGQFLAIVEGAMGLGIIVFYFTFIPAFQTAVQSRQAKVAWLYARSGAGISNFTLVEWFGLCGATDWTGFWEEWELWFRNIAETHVLTPILAFVPTVHHGQTWLNASAVALDSVSLYIVALGTNGVPSAGVCFKAGVEALRLVAAELPAHNGTQMPQTRASATRGNFEAAFEQLKAQGAHVTADRDVCWLRFAEMREEYQGFLLSLAASLLVPIHDILLPLSCSISGVEKNSPAEAAKAIAR